MAEEILPLAVLYVDIKSFWVFTSEGRLVVSSFPEGLIKDFEVIDKSKLIDFIKKFVDSQGIVRSSLIFVFTDNLCFIKDFPEGLTEEKEGQTKSFFDSVPFERVLSRVYPLTKGSRAISLNRDFYQTLRDAFEVFGFSTFAVIPAYVLTLLNISGPEAQIGQQIIKHSDQVKQYTMVLIKQPIINLQQKEEALAQRHTPLILLIFFVFLFVVVGMTFLVLRQQGEQAKGPVRVLPSSSVTPALLPTAIPTSTSLPTSATPIATSSGSGVR